MPNRMTEDIDQAVLEIKIALDRVDFDVDGVVIRASARRKQTAMNPTLKEGVVGNVPWTIE